MTALGLLLAKLAPAVILLGALALWRRVYPRMPLVFIAAAAGAAAVVLFVWPAARIAILAADALVVAVALADLATLPRQRHFSAVRELVRVASLRKRHGVRLTLINQARRNFLVTVRDGVPHELAPDPDHFTTPFAGRSRLVLHYELHPQRRGAYTIEPVHLRVRSRLGLWDRFVDAPAASVVHVYPDLKQLRQYALLARTDRLNLLGVRRTRRIGQDHEFERLRDYTIDDNYKHIEWRATARRRKLTVKDFQATQAQRIVLLLDCGRMMTNEAEGISLLDHGLNAALMLAYVALRQGDSVGMIAFSDEIHSFVPPGSGMHQMNRLLHAGFDRFPRLVESRYDQAFRCLATHCRRRALVILITSVIDEVNAGQVERYLTNLVGRHLPLAVLLRDRRLFEAVEVEHPAGKALWRAAVAAEILSWRRQLLSDLESKGALTLDVLPQVLTAPLINRYLEVKARHLL